uniref:Storage protein n=1 Tax=Eleusine coracana subsp. coracana TaxID=191504 RepID=A0A6G8MV80_ELECO|nr:storage protein [Eleusine coracana subsp. coracana]
MMAPSKMLALLAILALSWSAATAALFPQVIPTTPAFTAINHPCTQYCMLQQPFTTTVGSPILSLPFLPQQQAFPIIVSPWQQHQQCMLHCVAGAQIQQQQQQIVTISNPIAAAVQFPYLSSPLTAAMQVPFLSNSLATTALQVPFLSNPLTTAAIQSPYLYNPMDVAIQSSYLFNPVMQSPYLLNPVATPMQVPFMSNPMAAAMQLPCAL